MRDRLNVLFVLLAISLLAAACIQPPIAPAPGPETEPGAQSEPQAQPQTETQPQPQAMGPGFGRGMGMMGLHHGAVPEPYTGLVNPVTADAASLERGFALFQANCASCHGEDGMGGTELGLALDPQPAPVAHTSQMLGDDYLFWRISEGGVPFGTAMPAWKDALDEQARWDLINAVRNLDGGDCCGAGPGPGAMGMDEGEHRAEMLADAVAEGVITQEEADFFDRVHAIMDEIYGAEDAGMEQMGPAGMQTMQRALTGAAVQAGHITQAEADRFTEIHDRLIDAGVMR